MVCMMQVFLFLIIRTKTLPICYTIYRLSNLKGRLVMSFTDKFVAVELPLKIEKKSDLNAIREQLNSTAIAALEALLKHGHYIELKISSISGTVELYGSKLSFEIGSENFYLSHHYAKHDFDKFVSAVKENIKNISYQFE